MRRVEGHMLPLFDQFRSWLVWDESWTLVGQTSSYTIGAWPLHITAQLGIAASNTRFRFGEQL